MRCFGGYKDVEIAPWVAHHLLEKRKLALKELWHQPVGQNRCLWLFPDPLGGSSEAVLNNVVKSHAIPLHPAWNVNHPLFIQRIHTVSTTACQSLSSRLSYQIHCRSIAVVVFK